jgi:methionyl-tRNA formyltransferase
MKVAFVGASEFGLECLIALDKLKHIEIVGILTNEREFKISYNPQGVKNVLFADFQSYANSKDFFCYSMKMNMNEPGVKDFFEKTNPDLTIVVGWYHMIPASLLKRYKFAGMHASLLPDYSGGAPLVWAIINGEKKTGISFFMFDEGVDSGDIIGQKEVEISDNDTIKTVYDKIQSVGAALMIEKVKEIAEGTVLYIKQDHSKRRIFPQRSPQDGLISWQWEASRIYNFIRAQTKPYPGAFTNYLEKKMIIWNANVCENEKMEGTPGQIIEINENNKSIKVLTGKGVLQINEINLNGMEGFPADIIKNENCILT